MPFSRSNGVDIWYEVAGDGPAMVLVHANPFDHDLWMYQTAHFSTDSESKTSKSSGGFMSKRKSRKLLVLSSAALAATAAMSALTRHAQAVTLYWDSNGTGSAGAGTTPGGTWDGGAGGSAFWNTDSTGNNGGSIGNYTAQGGGANAPGQPQGGRFS